MKRTPRERAAHNSNKPEDMWNRVNKTDSCWLWTGPLTKGYGDMRVRYKNWGVHRLSWEIHHGTIPEGMQVLHRCDVRHCVRPDHLFLGTGADNIADMYQKGRNNNVKGERIGTSKLTEETVHLIRATDGLIRYDDLANRLGVGKGHICRIRAFEHWSWLPEKTYKEYCDVS